MPITVGMDDERERGRKVLDGRKLFWWVEVVCCVDGERRKKRSRSSPFVELGLNVCECNTQARLNLFTFLGEDCNFSDWKERGRRKRFVDAFPGRNLVQWVSTFQSHNFWEVGPQPRRVVKRSKSTLLKKEREEQLKVSTPTFYVQHTTLPSYPRNNLSGFRFHDLPLEIIQVQQSRLKSTWTYLKQ